MKINDCVKSSLIFAGAYISTCVGASFGTGQELLQFFASYGIWGVAGAILAVGIFTMVLFVCIFDARKHHFKTGEELFIYYGGKVMGRILYWYTILSMLLSASLLLSGAGATVEDYFGIPAIVGRLLIAVLVVLSVMLGLNKMVGLLGRLAVLIVIFMVGISLVTIMSPVDGIHAGNALAVADSNVYRPASNWAVSGFMYFTWCILTMAAYATNLAANTNEGIRVQNNGLIMGNIGFAACAALPSLAIICNYSVTGASQIPNIALANTIHPVVGGLFSVIVIICIYTTICPYIWTVSLAVVKSEQNKMYKIVPICCVVFGLIGASLGTFSKIVSVVTGLSARVGYVYLAFMLITKLFRRKSVIKVEEMERNSEK